MQMPVHSALPSDTPGTAEQQELFSSLPFSFSSQGFENERGSRAAIAHQSATGPVALRPRVSPSLPFQLRPAPQSPAERLCPASRPGLVLRTSFLPAQVRGTRAFSRLLSSIRAGRHHVAKRLLQTVWYKKSLTLLDAGSISESAIFKRDMVKTSWNLRLSTAIPREAFCIRL